MLNDNKIKELESKLDTIKMELGNKLAELRVMAGFPKRSYFGGKKSANILFLTESGKHFPNADTIEYYIDMYNLDTQSAFQLNELHKKGKEIKRQMLRLKRGWE